MPDSDSPPPQSRIAGAFMALLGFGLHLIIAFPLAFTVFATLSMLQKAPEHGAQFVYAVAGVCFILSLVVSCLRYRRYEPQAADADSAAFFLFARGFARVWSGR